MTDENALGQKAEARLEQVEAELSRLRAKAKESRADARIELDQTISDLEGKADALRGRLAELKESSGSAAKDVQEGLEKAWSSLSDSFDKARRHF